MEINPDTLNPKSPVEEELAAKFRSTREALGQLALKTLERLPRMLRLPLIDGSELVMVHGSIADPTSEISYEMSDDEVAALLDDDPADIVICGASHVPFTRELEEQRVIGLGSVGQAPEGDHAHFAIVTPSMTGTLIEQSWVRWRDAPPHE